MSLSLLSTCSWCVVSAYTWLALWLSLSSPPVADMWWAHKLDWLYLSLLSTCSWCVVSAYTWLALWLSLLSTCSWCVVNAYTWLALWLSLLCTFSWCVVSALEPLSCGSCRIIQVDAAHWWWFRRDPPPHMIVKRVGCTTIHNKELYKCIIHSFIHSSVRSEETVDYHSEELDRDVHLRLWELFSNSIMKVTGIELLTSLKCSHWCHSDAYIIYFTDTFL